MKYATKPNLVAIGSVGTFRGICETYSFVTLLFSPCLLGVRPPTDFDAKWLKQCGFTQWYAFCLSHCSKNANFFNPQALKTAKIWHFWGRTLEIFAQFCISDFTSKHPLFFTGDPHKCHSEYFGWWFQICGSFWVSAYRSRDTAWAVNFLAFNMDWMLFWWHHSTTQVAK